MTGHRCYKTSLIDTYWRSVGQLSRRPTFPDTDRTGKFNKVLKWLLTNFVERINASVLGKRTRQKVGHIVHFFGPFCEIVNQTYGKCFFLTDRKQVCFVQYFIKGIRRNEFVSGSS